MDPCILGGGPVDLRVFLSMLDRWKQSMVAVLRENQAFRLTFSIRNMERPRNCLYNPF